uniref:Lipoprotein n=1 Tax=Caenorhabditis tropicalis TaxID=1561998 RepID=A0A1I7UGD4_9PELO
MSDCQQNRCDKQEHKGQGMEFADLHNMTNKDDKKPLDAIFQEERLGMHKDDGHCKSGESCDQKKKECDGKKDCGMKQGGY